MLLSTFFFAFATVQGTFAAPSPNIDGSAETSEQAVNQTNCNGKKYTYEHLAGYGFVPSAAKDKYGDTLGGFGSSTALDIKSWKKAKDGSYTGILYGLPDRGWYITPFRGAQCRYLHLGRNTEGTLNYQNRIQKFSLSFTPNPSASLAKPSQPNLHIAYLDTILLTGPDGKPTTGLDADANGFISYPGFPDLPVATYIGDGFGGPGPGGKHISLDTEGIVLVEDGSFWISDEYGPNIYHFSTNGKMLQAIAPPDAVLPHRNGSVSFSADSPPIYAQDETIVPEDTDSGRANNQGLEGLTVSDDGKTLYALLQSALDQEGGPDDPGRKNARLLEYDISSGKADYRAEYVVTLPTYTSKKGKTKVAAQSEIHFLGGGQFFVLARDSGAGHGQDESQSLYRHVDVFDISSATDIKSKDNDKVGGTIASKDGTLDKGIKAAAYCNFLDFNVNSQLGRFGLHNGGEQDAGLLNEKWESIALAPIDGRCGDDREYFLISASDNDFITQSGAMNFGKFPYKDSSGYDLDNQVLVFKVKLPRGASPS